MRGWVQVSMLQARADGWQQEAAERLAVAHDTTKRAEVTMQASCTQAASLAGPLEVWAAGRQQAISSQQLELDQQVQQLGQRSPQAAAQQPSEELASLLQQLEGMERKPPLQRKLKNALSRCCVPSAMLQCAAHLRKHPSEDAQSLQRTCCQMRSNACTLLLNADHELKLLSCCTPMRFGLTHLGGLAGYRVLKSGLRLLRRRLNSQIRQQLPRTEAGTFCRALYRCC